MPLKRIDLPEVEAVLWGVWRPGGPVQRGLAAFDEQMMKLEQRRYRHTWRADRCHTGARDGVQHRCGDRCDHAGHCLNVNNLPGGALCAVVSPDVAPIERLPPVMNFNFLPDTGIMNG